MRDYGKVAATFWIGETGRRLRGDREAQVIALYLITCPLSNMIGLYYLPIPTLSHETGIPSEGALKGLQRLSEGGFCRYDPNEEIVWIPEMARFQVGEALDPKDNRCKGIAQEWQKYHKSPFYLDFYRRYRDAFHLPKPKPLARGFEGSSKPLRSQEQEQDQEQEQEQAQEQEHRARSRGQAAFAPPTVEQVGAYCRERGNRVDPEQFVDHYTANGWKVGGKSPMRDWRAAVRTWEKNEFRRGRSDCNGAGRGGDVLAGLREFAAQEEVIHDAP